MWGMAICNLHTKRGKIVTTTDKVRVIPLIELSVRISRKDLNRPDDEWTGSVLMGGKIDNSLFYFVQG